MKSKTLLILIFLPAIIIAQNISLKGNIVEAKSQEPLPGATILIKGTTKGVTSDFDGNFEINTKIGDTILGQFQFLKQPLILI
jgi:hypothetical protein